MRPADVGTPGTETPAGQAAQAVLPAPARGPGGPAATARISSFTVHGIRFPTSREPDGPDAMNPGPDHSAAYAYPDGTFWTADRAAHGTAPPTTSTIAHQEEHA
ncbi:hypothetical protein [Streptomyces sp. Ru73]|uniref:hypothetical protein n=1 Tax=Streptomyces sp. Ru73 TaxID=2080748 RepID=UPI002689CEDA